ncbi:hypothetical protein Tco_1440227 [Tanacetum coccineum]
MYNHQNHHTCMFSLSERLKADSTIRVNRGCGGGGNVKVVSVVAVKLEGTPPDAVRALKKLAPICCEAGSDHLWEWVVP